MIYSQNILLSLICMLLMACNTNDDKQFDLVITSANIINTTSGDIVKGQSLGINADTIAVITEEQQAENWKADNIIDASGKYLVPGLWDMHVHFGGGDTLISENKDLLPLYLANGVTTVRDCAADLSQSVLKWKQEIADDSLLGPNIFTSGPKLEGKNSIWPGDLEIADEKELTAALDSLEKLKVDFVKITDNALSPRLFLKSLKAARERGFQVSAHIPFELSIEKVSDARLSSIEHMSYLLKAASVKEDEISKKVRKGELDYRSARPLLMKTFDTTTALTTYRKLKQNGTAVVPTMIGSRIISFLDKDNHKNDPELQYLGKGLIETYQWRVDRANEATEEEITRRHAYYRKLESLLPLLQHAGVDIIAGTDAGFLNSYIYPGFSLHEELQIFVEAGLTPLQALQTSVVNGPKFFDKLNQYGSIEEGKVADILLLNSNPLENIKSTRNIFALIRNGEIHRKNDLDNVLEQLAE